MKLQLTPCKLGYGGTKEEMQRLLSDAKELTGIDYNIDNLGDVYDAIHVIQDDLGLTGVAAEEASQTFSGSFDAMKAAAKNFLGSLAIGENVGQALSTLLSTVNTFFFNNFLPMLGTIIRSLPGAVAGFLQEGIPMLLTSVQNLITTLANYVSSLADGVTAEKVAAWASTTLPQIIATAARLILQFAKTLLKNLPRITAAVRRIAFAVVWGLGAAIWARVTAAANGIKERFMAPLNALRDRVSSAMSSIKERLISPIQSAKDTISGIVDTIKGFFPISIGDVFSGLRLPHFRIVNSGSFPWGIGGKGSMPEWTVSWYAKGGIVPNTAVFGNIGLSEAGPEAIVPLDPFWDRLDRMAESMQSSVTINVYATPGMDVKALAKEVRNELISTENRRRLAWQ